MEARFITCPQQYTPETGRRSIFLAGGITGCPDWQSEIAQTPLARVHKIDFLNPRRQEFDVSNPAATEEQIRWEFDHLRIADAILFWFCAEQIQPIALFELGRWSGTSKPLFVGCNPLYPRRLDVVEQLKLARPDVQVCDMGLGALTWDVEQWLTG